MDYHQLVKITDGEEILYVHQKEFHHLSTDSRKHLHVDETAFFAIAGIHFDGHDYIEDLYHQGVRTFVVEKPIDTHKIPEANVVRVKKSVRAIQQLARYKRMQYTIPVVGITGSNGKTIVKEWLFQLLSPFTNCIATPHSYNSQLGVALSVWQIQPTHKIGVFEAGISQSGEMENLEKIIQPKTGIFTNIGTAHDQGFVSRTEKIQEKLKLFTHCEKIIYCSDHELLHQEIEKLGIPVFNWGSNHNPTLLIKNKEIVGRTCKISFVYNQEEHFITLPFSDSSSIENAMHCIAYMLMDGHSTEEIQQGISGLVPLKMRMEFKSATNNCIVLDDSYSNDSESLKLGLDFLNRQHGNKEKVLILSDIEQTGREPKELYKEIGGIITSSGIKRFVFIGEHISAQLGHFPHSESYKSTGEFLEAHPGNPFTDAAILLKGARKFSFEKIVGLLQKKVHGTLLEINLKAVMQNISFFRSALNPGTKILVMVKAFGYGTGSAELASVLQTQHIDYLGVAYTDEGVYLRQSGITIPIMVMNPSESSFESLNKYHLEPEIYSMDILKKYISFCQGKSVGIHIKLETGMNRLGFTKNELQQVYSILKDHPNITVKSIFSHLVGSGESELDFFTRDQIHLFMEMADQLIESLGYKPIRHILNTSGILRFREYQMEMVRTGLGIHGISPTPGFQENLVPIATLKTYVSMIKNVSVEETIGYSRKGKINRPSKIATIAIGYADGLPRGLSNGIGTVVINNQEVPIIGNVCMDMAMVDVTDIECKIGDEVIIYSPEYPVTRLSKALNTIPYEVLTRINERVKKIYYYD
ncbi:MAG: bifunctional UDP-N-acetylmuramoyl-tripeptide:D-alanyl-D-alanine ligase/alanine racemase [Cyclobacteriaceae bacterium]|nr:bifunctional UDP-N-acetylmuramoyl-tripeptide:D-alanyl-D-alanine ligase/alanine racemase [Cyclobacteriaceae bacterium]